jgi:hypothetical protein
MGRRREDPVAGSNHRIPRHLYESRTPVHPVSALLVDHLEQIVEQDEEYERARKKAVAVMKRGLKLGGKIRAKRRELRER